MSRAEQQETRSSYLLRNLCDERLTDEEAVELAELLATSDSVRRRYVELMQVCVELANWSEAAGPVSIPHPAAAKGVNSSAAAIAPLKSAAAKEIGKRHRRALRKEPAPARPMSWLRPWLTWGAAAATLVAVSLYGWGYLGREIRLLPSSLSLRLAVLRAKPPRWSDKSQRVRRSLWLT